MKPTLANILKEADVHALKSSGTPITSQHLKAFSAIERCRTGALGRSVFECRDCSHYKFSYASCGNRHCPQCQGQKTVDWVQKQTEKHLPVEYFMVTFTVPAELRSLIMRLQAKAYSAMFDASSAVIKEMLGNPEKLNLSTVGFTSILHTWGSQLQYHPHIHVLLPGGGLDSTGLWASCRKGFALSVRAASQLWMGKLLRALENIVGRESMPQNICAESFVVNCSSMGNGHRAIKYLARYVFRVAIHPSRIIKQADGKVTFRYKDKCDRNKQKVMTLSVQEFTRRFSMHVLPRGFMKVRHYGFHHPNCKVDLQQLRISIMKFSEDLLELIPKERDLGADDAEFEVQHHRPQCACCGQSMVLISFTRKSCGDRMTG
jgi:hypothetical protein